MQQADVVADVVVAAAVETTLHLGNIVMFRGENKHRNRDGMRLEETVKIALYKLNSRISKIDQNTSFIRSPQLSPREKS